jgi:diacylglycerol kinase (ATP)
VCEEAGWELVIAEAAGPEEARQAAEQARASGHEAVLALAGDGTLSDLVPALLGGECALAPIPCGTGNDFAAHLGLPRDPVAAARALLRAEPLRADVLEIVAAGEPPPASDTGLRRRFCLNITGVGFDARVAHWLNATRARRRVSGTAAYVWGVAVTLRQFEPQLTRIMYDQDDRRDGGETEELHTMMVAICNAASYGGGMRIAPMADITDGLLDVCVIGRLSKAGFVAAFPRVFRGSHVTHSCFRHRRAQRVRIETDPTQPVLVDGDVVAQTPVELIVRPGALRVLAPPSSGRSAGKRP